MKIKQINDFTYELKINDCDDVNKVFHLYNYIKKRLANAFYDKDNDLLLFTAEKVQTLKELLPNKKMSQPQCIKMIDELTKQMIYLKKHNYGFYGFELDTILIIDDAFVFCNVDFLEPISNDQFCFYSPIKYPYFTSPELFELTTLPSAIHYKCSYYSLGVLVVFCLFHEYLLVANEKKEDQEIEQILLPIHHTKIYWFIKRCFEPKIEKRVLLLI
jgi:hypothetical protein